MSLKKAALFVVFLTLALAGAAWSATQIRPALIQVEVTTAEALRDLLALDLDVIEVRPGEYANVLVSDDDASRISQAGFRYETLYADMVTHLQAGLNTQLAMGGYHTLSEIYAAMDSIQSEHPFIVSVKDSIGHTIQGRPIYAIKISDNPGVDEDEPEVFFDALTHAREPMGMETVLYFMRYLTLNYGSDARVDSIVNNREMWFIPCANPDGYEYNRSIAPGGGGLWRKNRRNNGGNFGVDLNRNYGYEWGHDNIGSSPNTGSEVYRGPGPFSEPETQSIRDFVLAHDFVVCINYHTYSDLLLYPWGFIDYNPPDRLPFEELSQAATVVNGYTWGPGYSTIYPTNGDADDWMYGDQVSKRKCISLTPEVGSQGEGGFWPPSFYIPVMSAENLEANLLFAERAGNYYARSFRYLRTDPFYFKKNVFYGDSLVTPLKIENQHSSIPLSVTAYGNDTPMFASAQVSAHWWEAGESRKGSPRTPRASSLPAVLDWLYVRPDTTISLGNGDSLDLGVVLRSAGYAVGANANGVIILTASNNLMPGVLDTLVIPVSMTVVCSGLQKPGDANADGILSLADIVAVLNFAFNKPGYPSCPSDSAICWLSDLVCRGDWNGDSAISLSDAIRGINYIFGKGGGPWGPIPSGICCAP